MSGHPQDVWVDVTGLGASSIEMLLAVDGREQAIADAKALFVHDRITVAELEQRVEEALTC